MDDHGCILNKYNILLDIYQVHIKNILLKASYILNCMGEMSGFYSIPIFFENVSNLTFT